MNTINKEGTKILTNLFNCLYFCKYASEHSIDLNLPIFPFAYLTLEPL